MALLARPIGSPFAVAFDNIDECPSEDTLCLLARVQRVVPEERIWTAARHAIGAIDSAMVDCIRHT